MKVLTMCVCLCMLLQETRRAGTVLDQHEDEAERGQVAVEIVEIEGGTHVGI